MLKARISLDKNFLTNLHIILNKTIKEKDPLKRLEVWSGKYYREWLNAQ